MVEQQNKASRYVPIAEVFFFFFLHCFFIPPVLQSHVCFYGRWWCCSSDKVVRHSLRWMKWRTSLVLWQESNSYSKSVHHSVLNLASEWV